MAVGGDKSGMTAPRSRVLSIPNELSEVSRLRDFVLAHCTEHALDARTGHQLTLVLEELVSNAVKYAYDDGAVHTIHITIRQDTDAVVLEIEDDGRAFDPFSLPEPNVDLGVEERPIGGLGVHLVRHLMDRVSYERRGDLNHLTLVKTLPSR